MRHDLVPHTAELLAQLIATRRRSLGLGEPT